MENEVIGTLSAVPHETLSIILTWQLDGIRAVQSAVNPGLTFFMKTVTTTFSPAVFFFAVIVFYWCVDEKDGFRLCILALFAAACNLVLKALFKQPRPFVIDARVGIVQETNYAFPSGHAQISGTVGLALAFLHSNLIGAVIIAVVVVLVGFSRVYLGVHFPTDVLGGWAFAVLTLLVYRLTAEKVSAFLVKTGLRGQLIAAAILGLLAHYIPSAFAMGGFVFGAIAGYALMLHYVHFSAKKGLKTRKFVPLVLVLRVLIGILGTVVVFIVFQAIIEKLPYSFRDIMRFIRGAVAEIWMFCAAPLVFIKFKLAEAA